MANLKFKITLAFDGSAYHGWQGQNSGLGVQNFIEIALGRLFPSHPPVQSSSRTDRGVHAAGLVAHFEIEAGEWKMREEQLRLAINSGLPEDIRVIDASLAADGFHARFDATGKEYHYHVWNHPVMNPLIRAFHWHVSRDLNFEAMTEAAQALVGKHDFTALTSGRDGILGDPVRDLRRCEIQREGYHLTFAMEGSGFLYKMCRNIVGTLVQIGEGKIQASAMPEILASKQRTMAGVSAPAHGLILHRVLYGGIS